MNHLATIDYIIIASYLLMLAGVGIWYAKKAGRGTDDFFLGGRSLPWWALGISMAAGSFASDTPLVITELVRSDGIQRVWWMFSGVITLSAGVVLFSRLWRRACLVTDVQLFEFRYSGKSSAILRGFRAFYGGFFQNIIAIAWVTFGMTAVLSTLTGWNQYVSIGICVAVALSYAVASGLYGSVMTDMIGFVVKVGSMTALAVICVHQAGGMKSVIDTVNSLPNYGPSHTALFPSLHSRDGQVAALFINLGLMWWADAGGFVMQRMSACRDEKDAVKATLLFTIFQAIRPWIWIPVGLVSIVWFPILTGSESITQAYPLVVRKSLDAGLRGLVVTSFIAAFTSTIVCQLNWGSSYLTNDIYKRFLHKNATSRELIVCARLSSVLLMLSAAAIVPLLSSITAVMEFMTMIYLGGAIVSFFRWFWWRINAWSEITALVGGIAVATLYLVMSLVWGKADPGWIGTYLGWKFEIRMAIQTGIVLMLTLAVTLLTRPSSKEQLEEFYRKVRPGGFWGGISPEVRSLPGTALSLGSVIDILGVLAVAFGLTLTIGFAILQQFVYVLPSCAAVALGIYRVRGWYRREVSELSVRPVMDAPLGIADELAAPNDLK
jgi:Na+/proline symporter